MPIFARSAIVSRPQAALPDSSDNPQLRPKKERPEPDLFRPTVLDLISALLWAEFPVARPPRPS